MRTSVTRLSSLALLFVLSLAPGELAAAPAALTRLFSGVASAGGANGTEWHSEVVLANATANSSDLLLELVPRGASNVVASKALTLAAGETRHLPDLYTEMGAPSGAGTLRVTGDALVWIRTFNQTANGTFGMDVPGVRAEEGFSSGSVLFPINTAADVGRDFRSNLLVTNLEPTKLTLTLTAGSAVRTVDVEANTFSQIDSVGSWVGAPSGPSVLSVAGSGRWFGVVTTIDPVLGDPTGMLGLTDATRDRRLFSGVASANGMNGTVWRSEARIYNPRSTSRSVTLEILPRGGSDVAASVTITLAPFELKSLPDVYAAVGAGSGAGTLRVTGDVVTWVRTFNKGPNATFGTDVPEVAPGVAYGSGAVVAFPINRAADVATGFRSNFLVTNHEDRSITLIFTAAGISRTLDVAAGSFIQQDNLGAFLDLPTGTTTVKVTANGRWSAIVTAIDPYLGDPTTVLGLLTTPNPMPTAAGVPDGNASSATIGAAGGTIASADGRVTLTIPSGALTAPTAFTVQPLTNKAWGGLGKAYRITPAETAFARPATLTFATTADDTSLVALGGLGIAEQDADGYWHWAANPSRDPATGRVSILVSSLSPPPKKPGIRPLTVFRVDSFSLVQGVLLQPRSAVVEIGKRLVLKVVWCYPVSDDGSWPGNECSPYGTHDAEPIGTIWYVDGIMRGNSTVGTISSSDRTGAYAEYVAPERVPSPDTVAISGDVGDLREQQKILVVSHVKILGNDFKGTFTLKVKRADQSAYTVKGDAKLNAFLSDENGTAYDMTGTLTIDSSFSWYGLTCTCQDPLTKPIPADSVFSIQRKPTVGQRWVMGGVVWNFTCVPGPVPMQAAVQYFVSAPGNCSQQSWVALPDEQRPAGSFVSTCNPAFTVDGSWSFGPE